MNYGGFMEISQGIKRRYWNRDGKLVCGYDSCSCREYDHCQYLDSSYGKCKYFNDDIELGISDGYYIPRKKCPIKKQKPIRDNTCKDCRNCVLKEYYQDDYWELVLAEFTCILRMNSAFPLANDYNMKEFPLHFAKWCSEFKDGGYSTESTSR